MTLTVSCIVTVFLAVHFRDMGMECWTTLNNPWVLKMGGLRDTVDTKQLSSLPGHCQACMQGLCLHSPHSTSGYNYVDLRGNKNTTGRHFTRTCKGNKLERSWDWQKAGSRVRLCRWLAVCKPSTRSLNLPNLTYPSWELANNQVLRQR